MDKNSKIYIPGYQGLVGSAIRRKLEQENYSNLILSDSEDFDLRRQHEVEQFFERQRPEYVFLAAAKVGGIMANKNYPADFIYCNLAIQTNIIHAAYQYKVKKLLFLGSSCIYPKLSPQPIKEEYLLTAPLESTNEAYAIAKIAGLKMCVHYNAQYQTNFIPVMPTNLYGPGDNYHLETSHVLPALIRKLHLAKSLENKRIDLIREDLDKNPIEGIDGSADDRTILEILKKYGILQQSTHHGEVVVELWGSGAPRREFLHVDDLAEALVFLMESYDYRDIDGIINIGVGTDLTIKELSAIIKDVVGFKGRLLWDTSKPDGTPRKLLDVSRLRQLGWKEKFSLIKGITDTYLKYSG